MSNTTRIELANDSEAQVVGGLLEEAGIPHYIRTYHDSAYDGLFQTELGWGYVETPSDHAAEVMRIVEDVRQRDAES